MAGMAGFYRMACGIKKRPPTFGQWALQTFTSFYISKIPDEDRKQKVKLLSSILKMNIVIDDEIISRAKELNKMGFKSFDAFHIACAEKGQADVLLTTDDHSLKKATSQGQSIKVRLENPLRWLMEELIK